MFFFLCAVLRVSETNELKVGEAAEVGASGARQVSETNELKEL